MNLFNKNTFLGALLGLAGISFVFTFTQGNANDKAGKSGNLSKLEPEVAKFFVEDLSVFQEKTKPGPSDWLASHDEPGQTFGQYLDSNYNFLTKKRSVLYVMPLGEFKKSAPSLTKLKKYMEAYYTPLEIRVLDPIDANQVKTKRRTNGETEQWNSSDILKWMRKDLPKDAYAMLAVTMTDLYPAEKWNFVFGQASYRDRVGVFSFARYGDEKEEVALLRAGKILTHEMGHMFGIKHCIFYQCNMNGVNHLQEMDHTLANLCPVCLRKLHHVTSFNPKKRYEKLLTFYEKHQLHEQAIWVKSRLQ